MIPYYLGMMEEHSNRIDEYVSKALDAGGRA